jgi:uncharacterized Zn finger protein (UPF0148 family)
MKPQITMATLAEHRDAAMTCYQCEECHRFYRAETGPIACPRCNSKDRETCTLTDAIYDAAMVTRDASTGKIAYEHKYSSDIVAGMYRRIEARLAELGL